MQQPFGTLRLTNTKVDEAYPSVPRRRRPLTTEKERSDREKKPRAYSARDRCRVIPVAGTWLQEAHCPTTPPPSRTAPQPPTPAPDPHALILAGSRYLIFRSKGSTLVEYNPSVYDSLLMNFSDTRDREKANGTDENQSGTAGR